MMRAAAVLGVILACGCARADDFFPPHPPGYCPLGGTDCQPFQPSIQIADGGADSDADSGGGSANGWNPYQVPTPSSLPMVAPDATGGGGAGGAP
jgi:hypothetical protein